MTKKILTGKTKTDYLAVKKDMKENSGKRVIEMGFKQKEH